MSTLSAVRGALFVVAGAVVIGLLLETPQWLHMMSPQYHGIPVLLNSDEEVYIARVEEGLTGRPALSAEAFIGDPDILGSQPALIERAIGTIFAPTGLRAPMVLQIMDFVVGVLFFLCLYGFLRQCGFSFRLAYAGTAVISLIELYNLNRPIHQGPSTILALAAFAGILAGLRGNIGWGIMGGVFLGLLFGDYFWSWSFGWLWFGVLCLWLLIESFHTRKWSACARATLFGGVGLLVAAPFIMRILTLTREPIYEQAVFRSGMFFSHMPESWIYSALFFCMMLGVLWSARHLRRHRGAVITVITACIAINQQLVHGHVFNFVSHYLLLLSIAAMAVILLLSAHRHLASILATIAAIIYLVALTYDGRYVLSQFAVHAQRFGQQHFATLLPILDELPRATILSDPKTSLFLAGFTKHDVVYTLYIKNVLMTHEEIAQRYCLTQVPVAPAKRDLEHVQAIYPDADSAFKDDPAVPAKEIEMLKTACAAADRNPVAALKDVHAQYVLWDEQNHPEWNIQRFRAPLVKTASGDGWSLYQLRAASSR